MDVAITVNHERLDATSRVKAQGDDRSDHFRRTVAIGALDDEPSSRHQLEELAGRHRLPALVTPGQTVAKVLSHSASSSQAQALSSSSVIGGGP